MKYIALRLLFLILASKLLISCYNKSTCKCESSIQSNLVRNYLVRINVRDGKTPIPNTRLSMKTGEFWMPPALTDSTGNIEFSLDNKDEIDTLYFDHPGYNPLNARFDFKNGNFLNCTVQLERTD